MGCDGGTIPKRDELVRTKKKPEQADKDAETVAKWKHCALSQEELRLPIVSCELGRLYNKDAVIEYLLEKVHASNIAQHIRNLKDITELKLTNNPAVEREGADKGDEYKDHGASKFICPVVGIEMNGKYKFCYFRACACVVSIRAMEIVKSETCHKCGKVYATDDVITINGTSEEVSDLRTRMEARRLKQKLDKKAKKKKLAATETQDEPLFKKPNLPPSLAVKVNGEASTSTSTSTITGTKSKLVNKPEATAAKEGRSIAKDPNRSEAFKSLFTSHDSFKQRPVAHWITYNPLYN